MEGNNERGKNNPFINLPAFMFFVFVVSLISPSEYLYARPMTKQQAEKAVKGWLKLDPNPLRTPLGNKVSKVDVYTDDNEQPTYYVIYLQPSGFVIVPADDMVEPIIAFTDDGIFDPSEDNPLGALVSRDIPGRMSAVRELQATISAEEQKQLTTDQEALQKACFKAQDKWNKFHTVSADEKTKIAELSSISDIRVAPLLQSKWSQSGVCGEACYNYYTPPYEDGDFSNYVCGCTATAIAQLIRYHEYPTSGIGVNEFTIYIEGASTTATTRGGDGSGGPYNWGQMVLVPSCGITLAQRQAIGALCYDVGVSVNMNYGPSGSSAGLLKAKDRLPDTFGYSNAIAGFDGSDLSGPGLNGMANPNLDSGHPVLLAIWSESSGHAVVADGYGYDSSTLYHHINMGWGGGADAWYNLPDILSYNSIDDCIYNIFTTGSGEIISGRVTDDVNNPIIGATVTGVRTGGGTYNDTTDSNGIYALAKVPSASTYTISVTKFGYSFTDQNVATGTSTDYNDISGNKWGINFVGTPTRCNTITIGIGTLTWSYPMYTYYHDSRTQVIYLASEIGSSGNITELALYVSTVPGQIMNNWTIRMKHTSMNFYPTASLDATGWTTVYQANEPMGVTGWRTFTFSTPFNYNGSDNLLVDFSHNNSSFTSAGLCRYSTIGGTRTAYARSDSENGDPLTWSGTSSPSVYGTTKVPNVQLTICSVIAGDFDSDGDVDLDDLDILASAWLSGPGDGNWNPDCDIADPPDNFIDFSDYAVFAGNWHVGVE